MKRGRTYEKIILAFVFIMVLAGSGCSKKDDNTSNTRLKKIIGHYGDYISWYEYLYDANGNMIQEYLRSGVDDNGNATTESCMTEWVYDSEGMLTQINARWATDYVGSNFRQEYYYNSEVNASTDNRVGRGIISSLYYEFGLGEKTKVQSAHQYTGELLSEQLTHTYSYTYSNNGRVKEEYIDGKLYCIYEYDEYGNCVVLKDSKDYIVECEYDKYGNLVKYKYDNRIFEYDNEYNSDGKIVKMVERANGKVTRWWEYI